MLKAEHAVLVVIDIQGKLASLMDDKERIYKNVGILIQGVMLLDVPIIWTEQAPEKLGQTLPEIAGLLDGLTPLPKTTFSCCGDPDFLSALRNLDRKQILLTGIETHICVYQTARDLLESGYEVYLLSDAVSSRTEENRRLGIARMKDLGAIVTGTEMALFEMLEKAEGDTFKAISRLIR
jgi:nicotinamidase-related amidase